MTHHVIRSTYQQLLRVEVLIVIVGQIQPEALLPLAITPMSPHHCPILSFLEDRDFDFVGLAQSLHDQGLGVRGY